MGGNAPEKPVTAASPVAYKRFGAGCALRAAGCIHSSRPKAAADHGPAWRLIRRSVRSLVPSARIMVAYCATSLMQVPVTGSGVVCAGQQKPHDVTCDGSQQVPLSVMPSSLGQTGTQLP